MSGKHQRDAARSTFQLRIMLWTDCSSRKASATSRLGVVGVSRVVDGAALLEEGRTSSTR